MRAGRESVLLVEADPELRRELERCCARMNLQSLTAAHYQDAVSALSSRRPDVISVELRLPNESGYELCEYIRSSPGLLDVPILMTSSEASLGDLAEAEEAGADAFLSKPFTMEQFGRQLISLLDSPRSIPASLLHPRSSR